MNLRLVIVLCTLAPTLALGDEGLPKPGVEVKAIGALIGNFNMKGTSPAGAMGQGSPEMATKGKLICNPTLEGFWIGCEIDEEIGTGMQAMKLHIHFLAGWDREAGEYRAVGFDNTGTSTYFSGKLAGTRLTFDPIGNYNWQGQPAKERLTFDMTDTKALKFIHDISLKGAAYTTLETADLRRWVKPQNAATAKVATATKTEPAATNVKWTAKPGAPAAPPKTTTTTPK